MKFIGRLGGGSKDEEAVGTLVAMGFERGAALAALRETGGRLEPAIERLTRPVPPEARTESIDQVSKELVSNDIEAARCLLTVLSDVAASPSGSSHRVLPSKGKTPIGRSLGAGGGAGERVLRAAGYQVHPGTGTLALTKYDATRLNRVKASLETAVAFGMEQGVTSSAQQMSAARESARQNRALVAASFAGTNEPEGVGAMLLFVLPGGSTVRRKFDSDHTLDKAIRFLATVQGTPPDLNDRGSWRVLIDGPAPAWWCDAWTIVDADNPSRIFEARDAFQTLTHLGLWPSATLRLLDSTTHTSLSAASDYRHHQQQKKAASLTSATKPKPSELMRQVQTRFETQQQPLSSAATNVRKQHYNVAKSADKVPGLPQLINMGFPEDKARAALRSYDGDLQRALDALLRGGGGGGGASS